MNLNTNLIKSGKYCSLLLSVLLPFLFLSLPFPIFFILWIGHLIFEFSFGTKITNFGFLLFSVITSRFFAFPVPELGGEIESIYISQLTNSTQDSLFSFLEPGAFFLLKFLNWIFNSPMSAIKMFRIIISCCLCGILYNYLLNFNKRKIAFIGVILFMYFHTQLISFEQDQFKNFFAQPIFILFLISCHKKSRWRYILPVILLLSHLSYTLVSVFILILYNANQNKHILAKGIILIPLFFWGAITIIPYLGIDFLRLSQRIGDYLIISREWWKVDYALRGGIVGLEVTSTSMITIYLLFAILLISKSRRNHLNNINLQYLFVAFIIPFIISKMYLVGIPFTVDRFVMLFHGFWILSFVILTYPISLRYGNIKIRPVVFLFSLYLFIVTYSVLTTEQPSYFNAIIYGKNKFDAIINYGMPLLLSMGMALFLVVLYSMKLNAQRFKQQRI